MKPWLYQANRYLELHLAAFLSKGSSSHPNKASDLTL